jgi:4-hydroxy-tetrahydrodipicolinate reductase
VHRVQDARIRRVPFQRKIGAGLTLEEFEQQVGEGRIRHVGLAESITMIADAVGWKLDRITDDVRPRIAAARVSSGAITVEPGRVAGIVQDGVGSWRGTPLVRLHMEAYLGAPEAYDRVEIAGTPPLCVTIAGGIHGDIATVALTVNAIPKVLQAPPGLRTMRDMVLPSFFGGRT